MIFIFIIRFITATCLFAFLGKANIWLSPISNVLLAIGYRIFLIMSPVFSKICGKFAVAVALLIAALGALILCFEHNWLLILGAILVGIGLSVSGYLIKAEVAETPSGAAHNKIALNAGSLLSGLILINFQTRNLFFALGSLVLFISFIIAGTTAHKNRHVVLPTGYQKLKPNQFIGWALLGVAIGIKLFGVFSVLPQYLLAKLGNLPSWYGIMILINSGVVILLQLPIIHAIERLNKKNLSLKVTLAIMFTGMLIIAVPQMFYAEKFIGALIWTSLLTVVECTASYLDVSASRDGALFVKETAVGIGAGLTVLICRYFNPSFANFAVGFVGAALILSAILLLKNSFAQNFCVTNSNGRRRL